MNSKEEFEALLNYHEHVDPVCVCGHIRWLHGETGCYGEEVCKNKTCTWSFKGNHTHRCSCEVFKEKSDDISKAQSGS